VEIFTLGLCFRITLFMRSALRCIIRVTKGDSFLCHVPLFFHVEQPESLWTDFREI
jgi:hypothetical protein